jgi:hypothetical protein
VEGQIKVPINTQMIPTPKAEVTGEEKMKDGFLQTCRTKRAIIIISFTFSFFPLEDVSDI